MPYVGITQHPLGYDLLLFQLNDIGLKFKSVRVQLIKLFVVERADTEECRLPNPEMVDIPGYAPLLNQRQRDGGASRNIFQLLPEFFRDQLLIYGELQEFVVGWLNPVHTTQVGANTDHIDIREVEHLLVERHHIITVHPLTQFTQFNHDDDLMDLTGSPGCLIQRLYCAKGAVERYIRIPHHIISVGLCRWLDIDGAHIGVHRLQVLQTGQPRVTHRVDLIDHITGEYVPEKLLIP